MGLPLPLVNGHRYSYASIEIAIPIIGKRYVGAKSINYIDSLEPANVYGTSSLKIGRTRGKADSTGSLELYASEADDFQLLLVTAGLAQGIYGPAPGFMEIYFDIFVAYVEQGVQSPIVDTVQAVRITKADKSRSEGTDALTVKYDLNIGTILHNGIRAVSPLLSVGT